MHSPIEIAFRVLQLVKYAQNNDMTNPTSLAMYLPTATQDAVQGMVPQGRRLEGKGFSPYDKLSKCCGINLDYYMEDLPKETYSTFSSLDVLDEEEQGTLLLSAFSTDVSQLSCTKDDFMAAKEAVQGFLTCTGIDTFIERVVMMDKKKLKKLINNIHDKCSWMEDKEPDPPSTKEFDECLGSIFGSDNVIGDFVRNIYEHPKVICDYSQVYAAAVPDCNLGPLSYVKPAACVLGIGCEVYLDQCKIENTALDKCLPDLEDVHIDCSGVTEKCAEEGSVFALVPAVVSTKIPDICQADVTTKVSERYCAFQNECGGKKDFFTQQVTATKATKAPGKSCVAPKARKAIEVSNKKCVVPKKRRTLKAPKKCKAPKI